MLGVLAPQLVFRSDQRVTAAGIHDIARLDTVAAPVVGPHVEQRFARIFLLDLDDLLPLAGVGAAFARMVIEHLVEILAPNLIGMRRTVADGARKGVGAVAPLVFRLEIRAELEYAERSDLLEHAQAFEDRQIHRQQRFADVKARMMRLLEGDNLVAAACQQNRGRASRRAPADDRDIAIFRCRCHLRPALVRFRRHWRAAHSAAASLRPAGAWQFRPQCSRRRSPHRR